MDYFLTYVHIIAGSTALLMGLFLMLRPKGTKMHVRLGWVYVLSMFSLCISALLIISFYRFSFFLMVIGVLTFYATFVGIRVMRRRQKGEEKWYDWAAAITTCLFGLGLFGYAVHVFNMVGWHYVGMLSILFGSFTLYSGWSDIQFFRASQPDHKDWWLHQHISAMGGSYIAAVTAFAVQNGDAWLPDSSLGWLMWVLPGVIGGPIIGRVIRKRKAMSRS